MPTCTHIHTPVNTNHEHMDAHMDTHEDTNTPFCLVPGESMGLPVRGPEFSCFSTFSKKPDKVSQTVHLGNEAPTAGPSHQLHLRKSAPDLQLQLVMSLSSLYCLEENGDNFSNIKLPFNVERRGSTVLGSHNQQRVTESERRGRCAADTEPRCEEWPQCQGDR